MNNDNNQEIIIEQAEPELKDYWYVILKRKEIILFFLILVFSLIQTPLYKSTANLEIKPERINIVEDLSGQGYYSTSLETLLNTQVKILQSCSLARIVVSKLNLIPHANDIVPGKNPDKQIKRENEPEKDKMQSLISSLLGSQEVKMIRGTRLIEVSFLLPDPALAQSVVNSWVDNFITMSANIETMSNRSTNEFIIEQINKLKNEISEKEAKLRGLSQDNEIVIMDEKLNIAMKNLSQLNTSLFDAQSERINKEALYNNK